MKDLTLSEHLFFQLLSTSRNVGKYVLKESPKRWLIEFLSVCTFIWKMVM